MIPALSRRSGFTLLEILLVTIILAILIGLVTPRFRNTFDDLQFKNFVLNTASLLRYAHDRAILEKDAYRLAFVQNPAGCRLEKSDGAQFKILKDRTGAVRLLPGGIHINLDVSEIILYPDGNATPATWIFSDKRGKSLTIHVSAASGAVSLEESDAR